MKRKLKLTLIWVLVSLAAAILFSTCTEEDTYKDGKTPAPTGFRVYSSENLRVQLRWDEVSRAKHEINYRSPDMDWWDYENLKGFGWDRYTVQFKERDVGKFYTFRLRAFMEGYSWSDWVETTATVRK